MLKDDKDRAIINKKAKNINSQNSNKMMLIFVLILLGLIMGANLSISKSGRWEVNILSDFIYLWIKPCEWSVSILPNTFLAIINNSSKEKCLP